MDPDTSHDEGADRAGAGREVEWQFDAVDLRPVARWLEQRAPDSWFRVEAPSDHRIVDEYADTEDWRLYRAGYSLRIRLEEGRREPTLKSLTPSTRGLRDRLEITEPLGAGGLPQLGQSSGPVGSRVRALAGPRPLRRLFEIRTLRRRYPVHGEAVSGEVSLDDTIVPIAGEARPAGIQRVEVEVVSGTVDDLEPFVDALRRACRLEPAAHSKFEAGLLATGLVPAGLPDLGPTDVHDGLSVGEVAFACMRKRFADFLGHEPGVRLGEDPEEIHDMRVATRRIRAGLSLFAEAIPVRAARFRGELKWVGGALGRVRDLDVQLEQLESWAGELTPDEEKWLLGPIRLIEDRRTAEHRKLLRLLDSRRFERLVDSFATMLQQGSLRRGPSRAPIRAVAPDLLRRRYRAVRRAGDGLTEASDPAGLHKLRIRCKRLRYALEFLQPVYPRSSRRLIRRLVAVQDVLGSHQDAQVAMSNLQSLAADRKAKLPPDSVFLLGRIAQRYEQVAEDDRRKLIPLYRKLRGRAWTELHKEMELGDLPGQARSRREA